MHDFREGGQARGPFLRQPPRKAGVGRGTWTRLIVGHVFVACGSRYCSPCRVVKSVVRLSRPLRRRDLCWVYVCRLNRRHGPAAKESPVQRLRLGGRCGAELVAEAHSEAFVGTERLGDVAESLERFDQQAVAALPKRRERQASRQRPEAKKFLGLGG